MNFFFLMNVECMQKNLNHNIKIHPDKSSMSYNIIFIFEMFNQNIILGTHETG